jgi:FkbM family methyltransferase
MNILHPIRRLTNKYYVKGLFRLLWIARRLLVVKEGIYLVDDDNKMHLDSEHYYQWMIATTGYYSFGIRKLIRQYLCHGDTFIDVGANIGYLSLLASTIVGEQGVVFAFEPDPRAVVQFKRNMTLNRIGNVILLAKACSDNDGRIALHVARQLDWSTALPEIRGLEIESQVEVDRCSLDSMAHELWGMQKPKLIKIDVEGYEPVVLRGATEIIRAQRTIFIIEVNHQRLSDGGFSIIDICGPFKDLGYVMHWIVEKRELFNSLDEVDLTRIYDPLQFANRSGDILFVPKYYASKFCQ